MHRTARALLGRSVGLVLSGGGAMAFARSAWSRSYWSRDRARPGGRLEHGGLRRRSGGDGARPLRTITLGSLDTAAVGQQHADLLITPDVRAVSMVAFDQLARLREAGRLSARAALEQEPGILQKLTAA
jgi:predicted acylesterase/phospholipase RssA